jgi:hypothetical protein
MKQVCDDLDVNRDSRVAEVFVVPELRGLRQAVHTLSCNGRPNL